MRMGDPSATEIVRVSAIKHKRDELFFLLPR